ncbi:hypothetical protein N806_31190 [Rhodococcus sp. P27]|nr:hypothetical protein N806_31190 [Rhodococcus sp. P27]
MVQRKIPRVQEVVLPILRDKLPGVAIRSWIDDIDYRQFPMVNIRRVGGTRHSTRPEELDVPVVEMTAYGTEGLIETEDLYQDALSVLYDAVAQQTQTEAGYLHSIRETMGMTQFSSLFQDSWRVQGLVQLGVRPPRTH